MRIAVFGKILRKEDLIHVRNLFEQITNESGSVLIFEDFLKELNEQFELSKDYRFESFSLNDVSNLQADILFSLGGDGTLLDTLSICKKVDLPVLGINLGHLGFLTSVGREDCDNLLEKLKRGLFKIEEHYLLKADWKGATKEHLAINEVCVRGLSPSELLETEVYVNGEYLSTYSSDGLIAATPTGSTAYSMSCGGPIISPQSKCICLTPISPHNLTHRPLIIPEDSEIEFRISHSRNQVSLHLDSQNYLLNPPARILIKKAENKLKLVRMENNSFFSAIRNKLMWGTNLRNTNKND